MGSGAPEGVADPDLVVQLAAGSQEALAALYDRYGRLAYSVAYRVLGDPGRAEDAVQDAFLKIWTRASTFDARRGSLRTWLLTSVRNRSIDYLRGRGAHERQEVELQPAVAEVGPRSDPWREVSLSLERAAVREAMGNLPAEQRQAVELAYFGGLFAPGDRRYDERAPQHGEGPHAARAREVELLSPGQRSGRCPDHEELENLVAPWVLGALDAAEVDVVRTHIEGCASCREAASRLGRAVGMLPLDVEEVEPPARLRERIMASAAASRGAAVAPLSLPARAKDRRPSPKPLTPSTPRGWVPGYAAAAVVVLALAMGLIAGDLVGRQASPAAPVVLHSTLVGHQALAGARANVIDLKSDGVALVDFSNLPQLPSSKVYEVWLITAAGRADPAGVFVPDVNGSKVVLVGKSLAGYSVMAVTAEEGPAGTLAPTQQPELYGKLA